MSIVKLCMYLLKDQQGQDSFRSKAKGFRFKAKAKDLAPEAKAKDTPAGLDAPRGQCRDLEHSISAFLWFMDLYRKTSLNALSVPK